MVNTHFNSVSVMSVKRDLLVSTAFQLFYRRGVSAVGINEILAESGIAKKTLYNHFSSKDQLVLAVVEQRQQKFYQWLAGEVSSAESAGAKVKAFFTALDHWFNNRVTHLSEFNGCFFINLSGEFTAATHVVHQKCAEHKKSINKLLQHQLVGFIEDGTMTKKQLTQLVDALCLLKEGAISQAHVQGDKKSALKAYQVAESLLP